MVSGVGMLRWEKFPTIGLDITQVNHQNLAKSSAEVRGNAGHT